MHTIHVVPYCSLPIELNARGSALAPVEVEGASLSEATCTYELTQIWLNNSSTFVSWWDRGIHECIIQCGIFPFWLEDDRVEPEL